MIPNIFFIATRRSHSSHTQLSHPTRVAVIGGGVTGLAATYYAAKRYPKTEFTLFESSNRLGGVIESKTVRMWDGSIAVCEMGVRTLRANAPRAIVMIDLIRQLGLDGDVRVIPKSNPIASKRYVFYPDHLVAIPVANMLKSIAHVPAPNSLNQRSSLKLIKMLYSEPLFRGLFSGFLRGFFKTKPKNMMDDSIYNILERRFGKSVTEHLASALINGLFAGNMRELSARALVPGLWSLECILSAPGGMLRWLACNAEWPEETWKRGEAEMLQSLRTPETADLEKRIFADASVFSFKHGVGQLTDRLAEIVQKMDNVKVRIDTQVESISDVRSGRCVQLNCLSSQPNSFSHAISTLSLPQTLDLLNVHLPPNIITHVPVMSVILCYASPRLNQPHRGFGYLISDAVPDDQNPESALGVIFDSDHIHREDHFTGSIISVMLGGHHWSSRSSLPSTSEGVEMAKSLLKRHLMIVERPIHVEAKLITKALPQYQVGHYGMLKEVHQTLSKFGGSVRVAGNCYAGVGVHDCLFTARMVVERMHQEGRTGLEWCQ